MHETIMEVEFTTFFLLFLEDFMVIQAAVHFHDGFRSVTLQVVGPDL